jgi:hypothetical protein
VLVARALGSDCIELRQHTRVTPEMQKHAKAAGTGCWPGLRHAGVLPAARRLLGLQTRVGAQGADHAVEKVPHLGRSMPAFAVHRMHTLTQFSLPEPRIDGSVR